MGQLSFKLIHDIWAQIVIFGTLLLPSWDNVLAMLMDKPQYTLFLLGEQVVAELPSEKHTIHEQTSSNIYITWKSYL